MTAGSSSRWPERALRDWEAANSGRGREIERLEKKRINERGRALDRLLRAFESVQLSAAPCGYRAREVEKELAVLEAEKATLEAAAEKPGFSESVSRISGPSSRRRLSRAHHRRLINSLSPRWWTRSSWSRGRSSSPTASCPRFDLCSIRGGGGNGIRTPLYQVKASGSAENGHLILPVGGQETPG